MSLDRLSKRAQQCICNCYGSRWKTNHRHQTYRMLLRLTHLVQSNFRLFKTSMGKFPISFRASTIFNNSLSGRRGFISSLVLSSELCILHYIYMLAPPHDLTFVGFPGVDFCIVFNKNSKGKRLWKIRVSRHEISLLILIRNGKENGPGGSRAPGRRFPYSF